MLMGERQRRNEENMTKKQKKRMALLAVLFVVLLVGILVFMWAKKKEPDLQEQLDLGAKYLEEMDYEGALAA